jgi:hypothetical protein
MGEEPGLAPSGNRENRPFAERKATMGEETELVPSGNSKNRPFAERKATMGEETGLAPSGNSENPEKSAVAKVPVPVFSPPRRVVRGVMLDLYPGQETTSLLISPEGWLINLFEIEPGRCNLRRQSTATVRSPRSGCVRSSRILCVRSRWTTNFFHRRLVSASAGGVKSSIQINTSHTDHLIENPAKTVSPQASAKDAQRTGIGQRPSQGILQKPAEGQIRLGTSDHLTIGEIVMIAEVFQLQHHHRWNRRPPHVLTVIGCQQVAEVIPGNDRRHIPEIMVVWNDDSENLEVPFGQRGNQRVIQHRCDRRRQQPRKMEINNCPCNYPAFSPKEPALAQYFFSSLAGPVGRQMRNR